MSVTDDNIDQVFAIENETAVVTGGTGGLGSVMAQALAEAGARVVILSRRPEACEELAEDIRASGGNAIGVAADVTDSTTLRRAAATVEDAFGTVNILVNCAGGNRPEATTGPELPFFDLDSQATNDVLNVNFVGTFQSCQIFGRHMAQRRRGCIVNIASMASIQPLTRVVAYSAAKAAVVNFTQWLAVHMAQEYSADIRVNAIAPGFFLTSQNRYLLIDDESSGWTARGEQIVSHTPMERLGAPEDLVGVLLWLVSPASAFVTGITVPVDGGFSAYSGV